ncbi:exodeoxyribonuclease VII large subunit [Thaumasiovibrio sp. DFM-14]|uniref:exodeoxyribonuclease VII large subunit n=1 Tax=Thaumasiovibrio sp. DFM-14 TaxID=3384792 RepID=UPI0039A002C8
MTYSSSQEKSRIFTVSALNAEVRLLLESEMGIVWLIGELSNFSMPVSGHWYLTLKDSRAQVKCAMFKGNNRRVTFKPANGQQVLVKARLSLYEPRGDYQLIIESMQPEGDGRLQLQFDQLKQRLEQEGLFSQHAKLALPTTPQRVGIITSSSGAALQDILNVLQRRDPSLPIVIYPTMVQGDGAAVSIAQAIGRANSRQECDVLIVGRGGGSLEDLWAFNEEIVARTIAASQIPIISAVGHEVDLTIADLVADLRAPTPSAAAELVSRDSAEQRERLATVVRRLYQAGRYQVQQAHHQLQYHTSQLQLQHPQRQLEQRSQQLDDAQLRLCQQVCSDVQERQLALTRLVHRLQLATPDKAITRHQHQHQQLSQRLSDAMVAHLTHNSHRFALLAQQLDSVSPLQTLLRGYSMTQTVTGHVITDAAQVSVGDKLLTTFANGQIYSTVDSVEAQSHIQAVNSTK